MNHLKTIGNSKLIRRSIKYGVLIYTIVHPDVLSKSFKVIQKIIPQKPQKSFVQEVLEESDIPTSKPELKPYFLGICSTALSAAWGLLKGHFKENEGPIRIRPDELIDLD